MNVVDLPVGKLRRRLDARPLRNDALPGLIASIREVGIINPLRVRPISIIESGRDAEGWEITAGRHRFEAASRANLETVPCIIVSDGDLTAELAMIDENLCRADLSSAERAKHTARRKEVYEELHPETKAYVAGAHGANATMGRGDAGANLAPAFSASTAAASGKSERAVQRDAERGKRVNSEVLDMIRGTHLDNGAYLDKL